MYGPKWTKRLDKPSLFKTLTFIANGRHQIVTLVMIGFSSKSEMDSIRQNGSGTTIRLVNSFLNSLTIRIGFKQLIALFHLLYLSSTRPKVWPVDPGKGAGNSCIPGRTTSRESIREEEHSMKNISNIVQQYNLRWEGSNPDFREGMLMGNGDIGVRTTMRLNGLFILCATLR